ncbi:MULTISPECIES: alpha/beta family hydrolase [unclassified Marinimicrobium]|jgi:hypothetical protein|uniref:alpha/beta family hydrolase n=1 Tax=Marinimicrobium TaxID=359337 RepID=UPI000C624720|nr:MULTISPECIES: alpha/beta family hydrolase [unclassified Marinimicrobium]MAN51624.1 alpha/beta hydrolase [Marinimicrobium sp.]|tara:strand:- start:20 stop:655 length:636 start_codon:yes stop_codon:yes gene_type:complete
MTDWLKNTPPNPSARLLLAHGAGAPMDSDFMNAMAEGLCARGVDVWRFEFPYMAERRTAGKKKPPNRQPELLESWRMAIASAQATALPLLVGGKSLGGRMASLVAHEPGVSGLVCLGYPFHPVGKPDKTRLGPLQAVQVTTLIVQGTRDALGNRDEVRAYDLPATLNWLWLDDGDHDFKPRVKSGFRQQQHWQSAIEGIVDWIDQHWGDRP